MRITQLSNDNFINANFQEVNVNLSCDIRFQRAFTACSCVFKVISLVWDNQDNYFENSIAWSKRTLKTTVATQLISNVYKKFRTYKVLTFRTKFDVPAFPVKSFLRIEIFLNSDLAFSCYSLIDFDQFKSYFLSFKLLYILFEVYKYFKIMKFALLTLVALGALLHAVSGAGEKRPLVKPNLRLCRNRPDHLRFGSHRYALSWMLTESEHAASRFGGRVDWLTARNFCRERFSFTSNLTFVFNTIIHFIALKFLVILDLVHDP